jgi:hypothetical protein
MKKYISLIALFFCFMVQAFSQSSSEVINQNKSESTYKNIIKVNYLVLPFKAIHLSYERLINNYLSVQIQGYYLFGSVSAGDDKISNWYGFTPELRIYVKGKAPRGFFMSPYYQHYQFHEESKRNNLRPSFLQNTNAVGLCAGYQWLKWKKINIDLYGGVGVQFWTTNKPSWDPPVSGTGLSIRFGSTIGYTF